MSKAKSIYRKLPGWAKPKFGFSIVAINRLWLGEDHVLYQVVSGCTERYKRFYFSEIQAVVVTRTHTQKDANRYYFFLLALFTLAGGLFFASDWPILASLIFGIDVLLLIGLALNIYLGPTCICQLHTAVQVETLFPLGRYHSAMKTLAILKTHIARFQGDAFEAHPVSDRGENQGDDSSGYVSTVQGIDRGNNEVLEEDRTP
jgi:hypothetical protein